MLDDIPTRIWGPRHRPGSVRVALYSEEVGLCIRGPAQALIPYVLGRIACAEAQRPSLSVAKSFQTSAPPLHVT